MSRKSNGISKKRFEELLKSIKNIESKLEVLVTIQKTIQKASIPKPKIGKEQKKILKLCDKKHSMDDMVLKTNKKKGTIKATLNNLRNKGMIQSIKIDNKVVYERIR